MDYQREEPREETKVFILVKGHDLYGHERLEALMTDVSYSGACLHTRFPFEVNSIISIYIGGDLAAKGEVTNVITDYNEENSAIKTRIGLQLIDKYSAWPYLHEE
ncbi:MAG: PilZ domain-containing protein [Acidobacteria bacterium]|nr:PilZ domain-containing protein [Acidobacteriota bacterium]